jgi:hypothetical protein
MSESEIFVTSLTLLTGYLVIERIGQDHIEYLPAVTAATSFVFLLVCHALFVYFIEIFVEGAAAPSVNFERFFIASGEVLKITMISLLILAVGGSLTLFVYFYMIRARKPRDQKDVIVAASITLFWSLVHFFVRV